MNNNTIMTSEYKLKWTDHLFEVYSDFRRRNNISEWVYFFNRPEFANKKEHDDIARVTMNCMLQNPNISKKAVALIEEKLRFLDEIRKYENIFGYENMETYKSMLLGGLEFSPIDMFENTEEEKDYDGFMFALRDMYFGGAAFGDEQKYTEMLKSISETGIKHPYVSLIVAEHHIKRGEFAYALEELKNFPRMITTGIYR